MVEIRGSGEEIVRKVPIVLSRSPQVTDPEMLAPAGVPPRRTYSVSKLT